MKKTFYILTALLVVGCQRNTNTTIEEQETLFKPMIQEEIIYVSKNIEGLEGDKSQDWYQGDSLFFSNWKIGASEELAGKYKKAIEYYTKALNTKRYEISSYEVKLSLGRAYLQINEKGKARQMLNEFKKEAKKDLTGEEVEWGLTEEAKDALARDIEDCDYLLGMTNP